MVAGVASSMASQAGASRLLDGMGRDGVLPRSVFGYLDPKRATSVRSIWLMGILSFVGALIVSFQQIVELVNFGAFTGFILVNLSVIGHYYVRLGERSAGGWMRNLVSPLVGSAVCAALLFSLSSSARVTGFAWLGLGLLYWVWRGRGLAPTGRPR